MYLPLEELKKATELTRRGKLMEATRAIQRALRGRAAKPPASGQAPREETRAIAGERAPDVTDVAFRAPTRPEQARPSSFEAHRFVAAGRTYTYRLYVPPRSDDTPLPVIVMLHGCTQDAGDFAAGTAMNALAEQRCCIVVYPEQLARANSMRCWNWFDASQQQRGRGEPAMIAALATHVVERCNGDARRVYVAGLSAGGAMAALAGQLYPEVFAAVGVHSGLPAGSARDVPSAQAAMRRPARDPVANAPSGAALPTIVFHGRSDRTVHPDNGRRIVEEAAARALAAGIALTREEQRMTVGSDIVTRTLYTDPRQVARLEHWEMAAGTHAWSGGSPAGTYTDPSGPSASAAMIDFFLVQRLDAAE